MNQLITSEKQASLISHNANNADNTHNYRYAEIKERLLASKNLTLPLQEELNMLDQLTKFELGRFLLNHQGLNGFWTYYVIKSFKEKSIQNPLEYWILNNTPGILATQERFQIFSKQVQNRLRSNMTLASIPCGLMDDLLSLNTNHLENLTMVGIDLDEESIQLASERANLINKSNVTTQFFQRNAWELGFVEKFDLITSNGLNIYEPNETRVVALYKSFFNALKPQGTFITSFGTPPPEMIPNSTWKNVNKTDALKQKALFGDILQAKWQTFRTESEMRNHLQLAGFTIHSVHYDRQGIFPTIIAEK